tara:strand:+ start:2172 stop:2681 length:510 start_codon:yes stop_codon:yes gene_type:complete
MDTSEMMLNQPVPGEAMASELGKYPFDNPPLIVSPGEALQYLLDSYLSNNTAEEILKLIIAGVTLESLVNLFVKMGFMEGIFTVDVAEIIKPALLLHLLADARDAGVKDIRIMNDSNMPEISPEDFMVIKKELRGEEVSELLDMKEITVMPEMTEMPEMTGSFLDMENI